MAEAAEAKPVVEFTKVRDALFLSLVARFSSSSVIEKVISLSLSLSHFFFSLGGDHHLSLNRLFVSRARALTFISSLSLLSKPSRHHRRLDINRISRRKTRLPRLGSRKKISPKCSKKAVKKAWKSKAPPICLA